MSKITTIGIPTGGSTDQILKKKSNNNYDVEWSTPAGGGGSGTVTSITAGTGLAGGTITTSGTVSHGNTSSQASVNNSNGAVIQDITLDTFGHVTALGSYDLDLRYYTETEVNNLLTGYVPSTRTITINGTSYDLSINRTWSVGTVTSVGITAGTGINVSGSPIIGSGSITVTNSAPDQTVVLTAGSGISISGTYPSFTITNTGSSGITGSGTSGYVTYWDGTSSITGESNLFWDATNDRLGIKQASPAYNLDVNGTGRFGSPLTIKAATPYIQWTNASDTRLGYIQHDATDLVMTADTGAIKFNVGAGIRATLDTSGNLGLGVTPSAWGSQFKAMQIGSGSNGGSVFGDTNYSVLHLASNVYYDGTNFKYIKTGEAAAQFRVYAYDGSFIWDRANSGTAGNTITWNTAMTLDSSGRLGIGVSPSYKLDVSGDLRISHNSNQPLVISTTSTTLYATYVSNSTTVGYIGNGNGIVTGGGATNFGIRAENDLLFASGGNAERMRITSGGAISFKGTSTGANAMATFTNDNSDLNIYASDASGTNKNIRFYYAGTSGAEAMRITSGGLVAINTQTITENLNIGGTIFLQTTADGTIGAKIYGYNDTSVNLYSSGIKFQTRYYNGSTYVYRDVFTINSSGNVGINTTTPSYKLDVNGSIGTSGSLSLLNGSNSSSLNEIYFSDNGQIRSNDDNHRIIFDRANNNLELREFGNIIFSAGSTTGTRTDSMRITSSGNVGIGVIPSAWASNYTALQIGAKSAIFNDSNSNGLMLSYNMYSDGLYQSRYLTNGFVSYYRQDGDSHIWGHVASGTAGNIINFPVPPSMVLTSGGNLGINVTPILKLHVNGGAIFGPNSNSGVYISPTNENTINSGYGTDDDTRDLWLNYRGYQDGFTRFRDVRVGNGKGSVIAFFQGSTSRLGVGTENPSAKLVVEDGVANQTGAPTYRGSMIISNGGGSTSTSGGLEFHAASSGSGYGWRVSTPDLGFGNIPVSYQSRSNTASWTERLRLNTSGQLQLNNYTSTTSFTGTVAGLLAFDSSGNVLTKAVSGSDTYETGTWSPTIIAETTDFTSVTYNSSREGTYTKIGDTVYVIGIMATDAITKGSASGNISIGGLPFTTSGTSGKKLNVIVSDSFNWLADNARSGLGLNSATRFVLYKRTTANGADTPVVVADVDTGSGKNYLYFEGFYKV